MAFAADKLDGAEQMDETLRLVGIPFLTVGPDGYCCAGEPLQPVHVGLHMWVLLRGRKSADSEYLNSKDALNILMISMEKIT